MAAKTKKKAASKRKKKEPIAKKKLIAAIAVVAAIALAISIFVINNNRHITQQTVYDFGKNVAQGIDVSEHNGKIDWEKVKKNYDFAFIRVGARGYGSGSIIEDRRAKENMKGAQKAGIPFGVYFYTQAVSENEAAEEADFVLNIIKHYDVKLPVIFDFEYATDSLGNHTGRLHESDLTTKENTKIIKSFCSKVEGKGYISGVYASSSVWFTAINKSSLGKDTLIWVADYTGKVSYKVSYDIWQYSQTGSVDGVSSKNVDLNYWYQN